MKLKQFSDSLRSLNTKTKIALIVCILALVATGLFFMLSGSDEEPEIQQATTSTETEVEEEPEVIPMAVSPLSGELVIEERADLPVNAVIVENSPDSRPQSGLDQAAVVFEAVAEAGITRFLALYQAEQPEKIGPIRSMRPYYIDWAFGFDASLAHVGGSPAANQISLNIGLKDLNQGTNSQYYYRDSSRYAPHNVYSSIDELNKLNTARGYTSSEFKSWKRSPGTPAQTPTATEIDVSISSSLYNSSYTYDPQTNTYDRSMADSPHKMLDKSQISPDVVVVMQTPHAVVDSKGRMDIVTTGSGAAWIFQNGEAVEGEWSKSSQSSPPVFRDEKGKEMTLNPGQVWVSVIATGNTVSY